jgi:hypothetical protein
LFKKNGADLGIISVRFVGSGWKLTDDEVCYTCPSIPFFFPFPVFSPNIVESHLF